ncbi:MAG: hypothetical protein M5U19_01920 [Microthrixaceae bacterium]|nr:hypothetical protein [Microthrixaceae bacterium]
MLFAIYGGYAALTDGISRAWVADLAPRSEVGTALGVHGGITGIGAFAASLWAGLAWGHDGRGPLVIAGAVVAVLAVVLLTGGVSAGPTAAAFPGAQRAVITRELRSATHAARSLIIQLRGTGP